MPNKKIYHNLIIIIYTLFVVFPKISKLPSETLFSIGVDSNSISKRHKEFDPALLQLTSII